MHRRGGDDHAKGRGTGAAGALGSGWLIGGGMAVLLTLRGEKTSVRPLSGRRSFADRPCEAMHSDPFNQISPDDADRRGGRGLWRIGVRRTPKLPMAFELSPERLAIFNELSPRYPTRQALTIPLLHLCQEQAGYVSEDVIAFVAKTLGLSTADVQGVVTFYTLFQQKKVGRNVVWVCRTLSCELVGAAGITEALEKKLGCHSGETTKDGEFTLLKAECLAACGHGPVLQVNDEYVENVTPEKIDAILDGCRRKKDDRMAAQFSPIGLRNRQK